MLGFLKKLFGGDARRYEEQKKKIASASLKERQALAAAEDTHPEILYYLAKDADPDVRHSVAINIMTPVHASTLLANDKNPDVRQALAARLIELLPGLSEEKHSQLYAYAVQALGVLAQDEVLRIRKALSASLKDCAKTPPSVAAQLSRDIEREVSEPILRFCAALADDDLLDILSGHPEPWVVSAVAARPHVSDRISEAVVETQDVPANTILINNSGADIAPVTLQKIIERARNYPEWHVPIAIRKELSMDLARQLAGFVNGAVLTLLEKRGDFDAAMRRDIAALVRRRLEYGVQNAPEEAPEVKLARLVKEGKLTPEIIHDALVWQDKKFVILALAYMSRIHPIVVEKMLKSGSAKPVVALCWRAKLPMRLCVELQRELAKLQPRELLYAKGGTGCPLTPAEIKWQLEFYGVDK